MRTHHRLRVLSLVLCILAACASLTASSLIRRAGATPDADPQVQRATDVPRLVLRRPQDNVCVTGLVTFAWQWNGAPLAANQGFELRLWRAGQRHHVSLGQPVTSNSQRVELRRATVVRLEGTGHYLWSVALVQRSPYRQLGQEATPRRLYIDLTKPANASCSVPGSPTNTPGLADVTCLPPTPIVPPTAPAATPMPPATPIAPPAVTATRTAPPTAVPSDTPTP